MPRISNALAFLRHGDDGHLLHADAGHLAETCGHPPNACDDPTCAATTGSISGCPDCTPAYVSVVISGSIAGDGSCQGIGSNAIQQTGNYDGTYVLPFVPTDLPRYEWIMASGSAITMNLGSGPGACGPPWDHTYTGLRVNAFLNPSGFNGASVAGGPGINIGLMSAGVASSGFCGDTYTVNDTTSNNPHGPRQGTALVTPCDSGVTPP